MSAEVVRIKDRHFQGWCEKCRDGFNSATIGKATAWAANHNATKHSEAK